ncbi:class I SAM-dependent methyltransferase [Planomonospora sp. ID91781]|uniref:Methyltransferase type 11 n=2 Tax=Planomonospora parontospora TaxID=58119 RepID=A0AA37F6H2_9ACTN|nr:MULTISPECIES: class I SAM-dependent methyltransferase [Planomonospora]MBG0822541.1 class I SAM-dependent methyltransferase [Planomonospora sp. ID91781]GGK84164.1 methyltransferase type 11 [Planomonospora parontospora]GII10544.1 methyltransferase type 11 [Planomonospora parontospora subsp. parontospora]
MTTAEVHHPLFARCYARLSRVVEDRGLAAHRRALLAGLSGRVIEVGAGNGLNFAHYPPAVTGVLAVEPEPRLRRLARAAAAVAPVPVEVTDGLAEHLPAADGAFDAAVAALVLCSLPDPHAGLAEMRRVLAGGGRLRFLEHVRAGSAGMARVQRLLDATVWPRLAGGCHTGRDAAGLIEQAGFTITDLERFVFPRVRTPMSFFVRGSARPATLTCSPES